MTKYLSLSENAVLIQENLDSKTQFSVAEPWTTTSMEFPESAFSRQRRCLYFTMRRTP